MSNINCLVFNLVWTEDYDVCLEQYTEVDLYKQLSYFCHVLDVVQCIEKVTLCSFPPCLWCTSYLNCVLFHEETRNAGIFFSCYWLLQLEYNARLPLEKEIARIRPVVDLAASTIQKIRDRCAYGWVQLKDLTVSVWLLVEIDQSLYITVIWMLQKFHSFVVEILVQWLSFICSFVVVNYAFSLSIVKAVL